MSFSVEGQPMTLIWIGKRDYFKITEIKKDGDVALRAYDFSPSQDGGATWPLREALFYDGSKKEYKK